MRSIVLMRLIIGRCERVKALHCFDISPKMIESASKVLSDKNNVTFSLLSQPKDGTFLVLTLRLFYGRAANSKTMSSTSERTR